jgi:hypothetical protein
MTGALIRRGRDTGDAHTEKGSGKDMMSKKAAICKPRREAQKKPTLILGLNL